MPTRHSFDCPASYEGEHDPSLCPAGDRVRVLEANHYREEVAALTADPIILGMAADMLAATMTVDMESGGFMNAALAEYQRRGGRDAKSIGGPARAIIAVVHRARARAADVVQQAAENT